MIKVTIENCPGFNEWRDAARRLILNKIPPSDVMWQSGDERQNNLFDEMAALPPAPGGQLNVTKEFIALAQTVICHADSARFDVLYRLLWRQLYEDKNLLKLKTDSDVLSALKMRKSVRRDSYKITAFLRFREIEINSQEHYIAWYEPEHYTLQRALPFFKTRFKNMNWSILTPYLSAHWNGKKLCLENLPDKSLLPEQDQFEDYWLTYYASIFNPARTKKKAMLSQMPKKYWQNMPETKLIPDLLKNAEARTKKMIENSK